jgi:hypothetical protein
MPGNKSHVPLSLPVLTHTFYILNIHFSLNFILFVTHRMQFTSSMYLRKGRTLCQRYMVTIQFLSHVIIRIGLMTACK